ncbi:MAG: hypothetical protein PHO67_08270 [Candidatus Omnitrophica bacterium]|nr:hypothetical protein [Candidatus Omnitrophota bacterium]
MKTVVGGLKCDMNRIEAAIPTLKSIEVDRLDVGPQYPQGAYGFRAFFTDMIGCIDVPHLIDGLMIDKAGEAGPQVLADEIIAIIKRWLESEKAKHQ